MRALWCLFACFYRFLSVAPNNYVFEKEYQTRMGMGSGKYLVLLVAIFILQLFFRFLIPDLPSHQDEVDAAKALDGRKGYRGKRLRATGRAGTSLVPCGTRRNF